MAGAALVVAGGSAYTAGTTVPASVAGFGEGAVTGATVNNVVHNLTSPGGALDSTALTFAATQQDNTVTATLFDDEHIPLETVTCDVVDP